MQKIGFYPHYAMVTDIDNELLCAEFAILENSNQIQLNFAEQIRSANLIKHVCQDNINNNFFFDEIAKILRIPFNKIYIQKLLVASALANSTLQLVNAGDISFPVVIDLILFAPESGLLFEYLLSIQSFIKQTKGIGRTYS